MRKAQIYREDLPAAQWPKRGENPLTVRQTRPFTASGWWIAQYSPVLLKAYAIIHLIVHAHPETDGAYIGRQWEFAVYSIIVF